MTTSKRKHFNTTIIKVTRIYLTIWFVGVSIGSIAGLIWGDSQGIWRRAALLNFCIVFLLTIHQSDLTIKRIGLLLNIVLVLLGGYLAIFNDYSIVSLGNLVTLPEERNIKVSVLVLLLYIALVVDILMFWLHCTVASKEQNKNVVDSYNSDKDYLNHEFPYIFCKPPEHLSQLG